MRGGSVRGNLDYFHFSLAASTSLGSVPASVLQPLGGPRLASHITAPAKISSYTSSSSNFDGHSQDEVNTSNVAESKTVDLLYQQQQLDLVAARAPGNSNEETKKNNNAAQTDGEEKKKLALAPFPVLPIFALCEAASSVEIVQDTMKKCLNNQLYHGLESFSYYFGRINKSLRSHYRNYYQAKDAAQAAEANSIRHHQMQQLKANDNDNYYNYSNSINSERDDSRKSLRKKRKSTSSKYKLSFYSTYQIPEREAWMPYVEPYPYGNYSRQQFERQVMRYVTSSRRNARFYGLKIPKLPPEEDLDDIADTPVTTTRGDSTTTSTTSTSSSSSSGNRKDTAGSPTSRKPFDVCHYAITSAHPTGGVPKDATALWVTMQGLCVPLPETIIRATTLLPQSDGNYNNNHSFGNNSNNSSSSSNPQKKNNTFKESEPLSSSSAPPTGLHETQKNQEAGGIVGLGSSSSSSSRFSAEMAVLKELAMEQLVKNSSHPSPLHRSSTSGGGGKGEEELSRDSDHDKLSLDELPAFWWWYVWENRNAGISLFLQHPFAACNSQEATMQHEALSDLAVQLGLKPKASTAVLSATTTTTTAAATITTSSSSSSLSPVASEGEDGENDVLKQQQHNNKPQQQQQQWQVRPASRWSVLWGLVVTPETNKKNSKLDYEDSFEAESVENLDVFNKNSTHESLLHLIELQLLSQLLGVDSVASVAAEGFGTNPSMVGDSPTSSSSSKNRNDNNDNDNDNVSSDSGDKISKSSNPRANSGDVDSASSAATSLSSAQQLVLSFRQFQAKLRNSSQPFWCRGVFLDELKRWSYWRTMYSYYPYYALRVAAHSFTHNLHSLPQGTAEQQQQLVMLQQRADDDNNSNKISDNNTITNSLAALAYTPLLLGGLQQQENQDQQQCEPGKDSKSSSFSSSSSSPSSSPLIETTLSAIGTRRDELCSLLENKINSVHGSQFDAFRIAMLLDRRMLSESILRDVLPAAVPQKYWRRFYLERVPVNVREELNACGLNDFCFGDVTDGRMRSLQRLGASDFLRDFDPENAAHLEGTSSADWRDPDSDIIDSSNVVDDDDADYDDGVDVDNHGKRGNEEMEADDDFEMLIGTPSPSSSSSDDNSTARFLDSSSRPSSRSSSQRRAYASTYRSDNEVPIDVLASAAGSGNNNNNNPETVQLLKGFRGSTSSLKRYGRPYRQIIVDNLPFLKFYIHRLLQEAENRRDGKGEFLNDRRQFKIQLQKEWDAMHPYDQTQFFDLDLIRKIFPDFSGFSEDDIEVYKHDFVYGRDAFRYDSRMDRLQHYNSSEAGTHELLHQSHLLPGEPDSVFGQQLPPLSQFHQEQHGGAVASSSSSSSSSSYYRHLQMGGSTKRLGNYGEQNPNLDLQLKNFGADMLSITRF